MDSMYEVLLTLPLFKGVSYKRMSEILEMVPFHFLKYLAGETVVQAGDPCTHIKFIISGSIRSSIVNSDGRFRVSQTLNAPDVIAPDYMFGRATRYPNTAVAIESAGIMQLSKSDFVKIISEEEIFLFNYLNLLSVNAQKSVEGVLSITTGSLEERIAFWILALSQRGGTDIVLSCRQRDLYSLFGTPRQSFLQTLTNMKERGLIDYDTSEIRVRTRQGLIDTLLHSHPEN
ncbi:MAG: Crp/Fnr family transcriptional regulator [Paramuribaculum sp.]|nr:Crp/Fnr family transcriptional regulator [Paramuribaculum sp.]